MLYFSQSIPHLTIWYETVEIHSHIHTETTKKKKMLGGDKIDEKVAK